VSQNSNLPALREIQVQRAIIELETPALQMPSPTVEEARAVDQVFAVPASERNSLVDAVNFAAAGMLLHDLVADTLAPPANEDEEEEKPAPKPLKPE
jgi:hypothetical protein